MYSRTLRYELLGFSCVSRRSLGQGAARFTLLRYEHRTLNAGRADAGLANRPTHAGSGIAADTRTTISSNAPPRTAVLELATSSVPARHASSPPCQWVPASWATDTVVALWPADMVGSEKAGEWDPTRPHWVVVVERVKGAKAKGKPAPLTVGAHELSRGCRVSVVCCARDGC